MIVLERRSQGKIPLQKGTASIRGAQRRRDSRQHLHYQRTIGEI